MTNILPVGTKVRFPIQDGIVQEGIIIAHPNVVGVKDRCYTIEEIGGSEIWFISHGEVTVVDQSDHFINYDRAMKGI